MLLILALLQYRLWFGDGNIKEFQRLNERIEDLKQESLKRRERNASLEAEVMDLKQGQDAIEERARQDLGMIKEGETFIQVFSPAQEDKPLIKPLPKTVNKRRSQEKPSAPAAAPETPKQTEETPKQDETSQPLEENK